MKQVLAPVGYSVHVTNVIRACAHMNVCSNVLLLNMPLDKCVLQLKSTTKYRTGCLGLYTPSGYVIRLHSFFFYIINVSSDMSCVLSVCIDFYIMF